MEMIQNDDNLDENGLSIGIGMANNDFFDVSRYRGFHCYANLDIVNECVATKAPFSGFYHMNTGAFFI